MAALTKGVVRVGDIGGVCPAVEIEWIDEPAVIGGDIGIGENADAGGEDDIGYCGISKLNRPETPDPGGLT